MLLSDGRLTLALYLAAGVLYVVLGVFLPRFVLSLAEGMAFLLLAVWLLPALISRLRRR